MKRIVVIGSPGSGKSTFSIALQTILKLPLYHLDQYYWKSNWEQPNQQDFMAVHDQLCDKPEWIIEGMYARFLPYRLERADTIIFLDIIPYVCLWHVLKRWIRNFNKPSLGGCKQCKEKMDLNFLTWIWGFKTHTRPKIMLYLSQIQGEKKIHRLTSTAKIKHFLNELNKMNDIKNENLH